MSVSFRSSDSVFILPYIRPVAASRSIVRHHRSSLPELLLSSCSRSLMFFTSGFAGFLDRSKSKGIPLYQQRLNDEDQALILISYHLLGDTLPMEQPGRLKHDLNHTCVDGRLDHVNSNSLCDTEDLDGTSIRSNFLRKLQTDLKRKMPLSQESCGQDKKSPYLSPWNEPAEFCDAIKVRNATREKTINLPGTSLMDAAKSNAGKSAGSVGTKRDWAWKYCYAIPGNSNGVICSFCDREIKGGGITRFKSHISGSDLSKNVKKCENVPPDVEAEIDQKGKKRR